MPLVIVPGFESLRVRFVFSNAQSQPLNLYARARRMASKRRGTNIPIRFTITKYHLTTAGREFWRSATPLVAWAAMRDHP